MGDSLVDHDEIKPPTSYSKFNRLLLRLWGRRMSPPVGPRNEAHRSLGGYSVKLRPGTVDLGGYAIRYHVSDPHATLWTPHDNSTVHISVLKAQSGSGKSTLLLQLYRSLGSRTSSSLGFDFDPDMTLPEDVAAAFLPQKTPVVRHWRVMDLIPRKSEFLKVLLPEFEDYSSLMEKRLGQLSGGQCMRVYLSSALEKLSNSPAHAVFLLLDETLDGTGSEQEVMAHIQAIRNQWQDGKHAKSLHMMIVSHKEGLHVPGANAVFMNVLGRESEQLQVQVSNSDQL